MARKNNQTSVFRRFHRSFGAGVAFFVMFMVLSGLALNHSNQLGLDQRHVSQSALLSWYGLGKPGHISSFAVDNDWLSFAGSQLYLNGSHVATISDGVGAVSNGEIFIAAGREELLLLDRDGSLIERLPWDLPGAGLIEAIGLLEKSTAMVKSAESTWVADAQLLKWQPSTDVTEIPAWSSPGSAPEELHETITAQYRGDGLSLERVLLDLHSGRVFGKAGVFIYDLLALAVGFLAISGVVFWLRGRRNGKRNGKRNNP